MSKILDYVRWRGDLTLDREPFNSLDAGLFAALSYLPFDPSVKGHTLEAATKRLVKLKKLSHSDKLEAELINLSDRYKKMKFLDWSHLSQKRPPVQFTAMTVELDPNTILISYRGTDGSMVGWNEDIDMSYQPEIFGQSVAADYLKKSQTNSPIKRFIQLDTQRVVILPPTPYMPLLLKFKIE